MAAYATEEQLTAYLGHTPDQPGRMLERASRLVDSALITAVYNPADETVAEALRSAVLEQCAEWDDDGTTGTEASDMGNWTSVSAGSISLGRGSSGSGSGNVSTTVRLSTQAALILQQAGLTGHGPMVGWW